MENIDRNSGLRDRAAAWPLLDYAQWRDTAATLQLWTQIVGKVRLSQTPWLNHSWHVVLYITATGLGTSPIHADGRMFEIEFDFVSHRLRIRTDEGEQRNLPLKAQSVSAFYHEVLSALRELDIPADIDPMPNEIQDAIPFPDDHIHASYDPDAAHRFWRALVQVDRVFKHFRTAFLGKSSPVHFFWGSFDLAVTRFSGRAAPPHPGGVPHLPDSVAQEAYSHEVSSAGFWPGSDAFPQASFYSYAYPEPAGYRDAQVRPDAAAFNTQLGEFILPYDSVRLAPSPDDALMEFLQTTYEAAADAAQWDRKGLECALGKPRHPRSLRHSG